MANVIRLLGVAVHAVPFGDRVVADVPAQTARQAEACWGRRARGGWGARQSGGRAVSAHVRKAACGGVFAASHLDVNCPPPAKNSGSPQGPRQVTRCTSTQRQTRAREWRVKPMTQHRGRLPRYLPVNWLKISLFSSSMTGGQHALSLNLWQKLRDRGYSKTRQRTPPQHVNGQAEGFSICGSRRGATPAKRARHGMP